MISFEEAKKRSSVMILGEGRVDENSGFFFEERVDMSTIPEGWYCYELRSGEAFENSLFATIEPKVTVNFAGTFLTQTPILFKNTGLNEDDFYSTLNDVGGYKLR